MCGLRIPAVLAVLAALLVVGSSAFSVTASASPDKGCSKLLEESTVLDRKIELWSYQLEALEYLYRSTPGAELQYATAITNEQPTLTYLTNRGVLDTIDTYAAPYVDQSSQITVPGGWPPAKGSAALDRPFPGNLGDGSMPGIIVPGTGKFVYNHYKALERLRYAIAVGKRDSAAAFREFSKQCCPRGSLLKHARANAFAAGCPGPPRPAPAPVFHPPVPSPLPPTTTPTPTQPVQPVDCQTDPTACASLSVPINGVSTSDPLTTLPLATGYGRVTASPPDAVLNCPYVTDYRACYGSIRMPLGTQVTLAATPDPTNASYFAGWSGTGGFSCPGSSPTCTVTVGQVSQITALFSAPVYELTVDNTTNPTAGAVMQSAFSSIGPTAERIQCGAGANLCTAYYSLVDARTMPNFNGPEPLSLMQNGIVTYDNEQWYVRFISGCDAVQVVIDGSNRYTVCYYDMTANRTIKVDWTTTPP